MSFSEGWGRGAWSEGPYNEPAPDVTVTPTAVTSTFATGTITHQGDALVSLSGLSSSTSLGTVSLSLGATITPSSQLITTQTDGVVFNETVEVTGLDISAGHQGWSRGEWNEGGWGIGIPGIEIGETSLGLGITVTPTGVSSTVTEGNFSVTGTSSHNPVGVHTQVFIGEEEAQAGATVAVTGIEMDFDISESVTFAAQGDAQLSTAQKKFGTASLLLDGTDDFVTSTDSDLVDGNFTVEFFAYASSFAQDAILWDNRVNDQGYAIGLTTGSQIKVIQDTTTIATSFGGFTTNAFNHIALSRDSGTIRVFVNGNLRATLSVYNNNYRNQPYTIGATSSGSNEFDGYIDEFRTSTIARYTAAFTPTTTEFADDTNTEALLHFDGTNGSTGIVNSHEKVIIEGDALVTPTGVSATFTGGDVDIVSSVSFSATGVSSTFTTGTLDQASVYSVTGIELDFDTGDETISGSANVDVTGIEILAVSGNMRSTPWANVQTNANNSFTSVNTNANNSFTSVNTGATNNWTEVAA